MTKDGYLADHRPFSLLLKPSSAAGPIHLSIRWLYSPGGNVTGSWI